MKNMLFQFEIRELERFETTFRNTFRKIYPLAKRMICANIGRGSDVREMMLHAIDSRTPTEYPFIFRFSYQQAGKQFDRVQGIAAAIHLLQKSTLVIDDIFDNSHKRVGKTTVHSCYGVHNAIIIGQLLQTIALNAIVSEVTTRSLPNGPIVHGLFHEIVRDVYLGQYLDIAQSAEPGITVDSYYQMVSLTTGKFLSNISRAGGLLANLSRLHVDRLAKYGYCYGMALQICDDIIDITRSSFFTGKTFASDIRCRRLRLPLILSLQLCSGRERNYLVRFLTGRNVISPSEVKKIIAVIRRSRSVDRCRQIAAQHIHRALEAISVFADNPPRNMLRLVALSLLSDIGAVK